MAYPLTKVVAQTKVSMGNYCTLHKGIGELGDSVDIGCIGQ